LYLASVHDWHCARAQMTNYLSATRKFKADYR
jgi:hypothetical protein